MSKDGSYSKKTTSSSGTEVYQAVPPPVGASIKTLPAERVLVTVSGTTYFLYSNAFYRRVMNGTQETFVTVTPPAGVVFIQALPADFEVVQLNTMYFTRERELLRALPAADGKELYTLVDRPPAPPARRRHRSGATRSGGTRKGGARACRGRSRTSASRAHRRRDDRPSRSAPNSSCAWLPK